jgi:Tetratricopeptide repeat
MADPIDDLVQRWRQNPTAPATVELCEALRGSVRSALVQQVGEFATQRHGGDVGVMLGVARMYLSGHRLSEAQSALVAAGKAAPRDPEIYRWLGEVLLRRGDAERAEKVLERAIQLGTRDADARLWLERARVFRPMQAKAGPRAVAAEIAQASGKTPSPGPGAVAKLPSTFQDPDEEATTQIQQSKGNGPRVPTASEASLIASKAAFVQSSGTDPTMPRPGLSNAMAPHTANIVVEDAKTRPVAFMTPSSPHALPQEQSIRFDLERALREEKHPSTEPPGPAVGTTLPFIAPQAKTPEPGPLLAPHAPLPNPFAAQNPFAVQPRAREIEPPREDASVPHPRDVLDALALAGVFEPPAGGAVVAGWDTPAKTTRRRGIVTLSIAMTLLVGGGIGTFFYVNKVRAEKHGQAEAALAKIEQDLEQSRPELLPGAEQALGAVFDLESRSQRAALDWLHERALVGLIKNGADVAFEDAIKRAIEVGVPEDRIAFARVASFLFQGDVTGAAGLLPKADGAAQDGPATKDAFYQLVAGETLERAGDARARDRYASAVKIGPNLVLAQVALARSTAIDGDVHKAADLAKDFRAKYPQRAEGAALAALAWGRDPGRSDQAPPEVAETIQRAQELPLALAFVPSALGAILAIDNHKWDEAAEQVKKALSAADSPGVASWLGSIAILTGDDQLASKAALVAVSYSALYAPALVLAARVALVADRIDESVKATENLDPSSPDVAVVRAAAAYERADANGVAEALEPVPAEAQKLPWLSALELAPQVLLGRAQMTPDKLIDMSDNEAPWSDLVAMDLALDSGDSDTADKIAAAWKGSEGRPSRALRLARLARYEGKLDAAEAFMDAAMRGTVTTRALFEKVCLLVARNHGAEAGPLLAKYPLVLGPAKGWLSAYALASANKLEEAKALVAQLDPPPDLAPLPTRAIAAAAFGALKDKKRGIDFVRDLLATGTQHPDVVNAALALGFKKIERRGKKPLFQAP